MATPPDNGHRPTLIETARQCQTHLEALGKHAQKKKAEHYTLGTKNLLDEVVRHTNGSIGSLKTWITEIEKGRQTSDESIINTVNAYFIQLEDGITAAEVALNRRLHLRWDGILRTKRKEATAQLLNNLADISATLKNLQNQVETVVRDSPDQKERDWRINEVLDRRSKSYAEFKRILQRMSQEERQVTRIGTLSWLWKAFPKRLDLGDKVNNPDDPGDGLVYNESDVNKATIILKDFYAAWSETIILSCPGMTASLPKMSHITSMAKICLILCGMRQERLVDYFCEGQKLDLDLPLSTETVKRVLYDDPDHAAVFATEQYRAVKRDWDDGGHIEVPEEEPLPLIFESNYGKGSYGTVQRYRDAFKPELYAVKEQNAADARSHLLREIAQLKKVNHRHIIQFVKSYQRGSQYGLLIRPAATTDLEKLLDRYRRNNYDYQRPNEEQRKTRVQLRPIMLTAFGCLSHGLSHIHGRTIRHKDIKPANILYERELSKDRPARLLWADFGLAYHFGTTKSSKTRSVSQYSKRYAAPERMVLSQAALDAKANALAGVHTNQDTDDESDSSLEHESDSSNRRPANGRSEDIFSFGCVFLEILSTMIDAKIPNADSDLYEFWGNITKLQAWAESQKDKLKASDPLRVPFALAIKMIRFKARKRPTIDKIVEALADTASAKEYFCRPCLQEVEALRLERERASKYLGLDRYKFDTKSSENTESGSSELDAYERLASQPRVLNGVNGQEHSPARIPIPPPQLVPGGSAITSPALTFNSVRTIRFTD